MSIGIVENLNKSVDFAKNRLFGNWVDWLILIILCIIPFIGWLLLLGFIVRVYRGGEAKLGEWIKMLIDGILLVIIAIIYSIIPAIVGIIFGASLYAINPMDPMGSLTALTAGVSIIGVIVTLIVSIIFGIMGTMAIVRFAKEESLGAAFQFGEIFKIIGKIGWVHYILSWIVLAIIFAVIFFIFFLLALVIIGLILMLIFAPFLAIWEARYFAQLYESA
ncbi:MAG: DUF4013 domain-containing protein [Methanocorpusculum sp.]|nr:DUF4013 domain-containing protein [Methanocorpusculum sp.]MDE2523096.1 DUF4013 domain-containing protein [Methanocorpusculum sp.]MDE2525194.1 DUF4013 domain-containing protein [Methanocorpusculum sp.]